MAVFLRPKGLTRLMKDRICGALLAGEYDMAGILKIAHRNVRAVAMASMALGVVLAGAIGWITAPV